ncbi:MAG: GAF domain-containing protein [Chloroflexi bacterium]|nr:GAF domain-containing protein [Chloroflexota bacterium]
MKVAQQIPHYFSIFPTGHIPVPVCIGELPMSDYSISENVLTEEVAAYLDSNPLVPGAIIVRQGRAKSVIPRNKMFERLGRRYGVELFLRKQIREMESELGAEAFILKSHLSINIAVKLALSRAQTHIYDPIVVEFENGSMQLLDMYVLLLSQSQLSNNLSGIVSSLNTIEMMLSNDRVNPTSALELIMENMGKVVPSHHACVILQPRAKTFAFMHPLIIQKNEPMERNSVYQSVLTMNQPIVLEDVKMVPAWINHETPLSTRSWLGVPIVDHTGPIGLISLSRTTFSPFTNHEKEISLVFSRYLGKLFEVITRQLEKKQQFEKKYQMQ